MSDEEMKHKFIGPNILSLALSLNSLSAFTTLAFRRDLRFPSA